MRFRGYTCITLIFIGSTIRGMGRRRLPRVLQRATRLPRRMAGKRADVLPPPDLGSPRACRDGDGRDVDARRAAHASRVSDASTATRADACIATESRLDRAPSRAASGCCCPRLHSPCPPRGARSAIASARVWPAQEYTRVTLETDGADHAPAVRRSSDPERLVLDLEGVELDARARRSCVDEGAADRSRTSQRCASADPARAWCAWCST